MKTLVTAMTLLLTVAVLSGCGSRSYEEDPLLLPPQLVGEEVAAEQGAEQEVEKKADAATSN